MRAGGLSSVKIGRSAKVRPRAVGGIQCVSLKVPVVCVDMYAEALKTKVKTGKVHRAKAWCFHRIFDREDCIDQ